MDDRREASGWNAIKLACSYWRWLCWSGVRSILRVAGTLLVAAALAHFVAVPWISVLAGQRKSGLLGTLLVAPIAAMIAAPACLAFAIIRVLRGAPRRIAELQKELSARPTHDDLRALTERLATYERRPWQEAIEECRRLVDGGKSLAGKGGHTTPAECMSYEADICRFLLTISPEARSICEAEVRREKRASHAKWDAKPSMRVDSMWSALQQLLRAPPTEALWRAGHAPSRRP